MSDSVLVLLLLVLLSSVLALVPPLTYRSFLVLTGAKPANSFPRSGHEGPEWYKRTLDAHANSLENLVLYIGVMAVAFFSNHINLMDHICWYYLMARLGQTAVHLLSTAHWPVFMRFTFWVVQMGLLVYVMIQLLLTV